MRALTKWVLRVIHRLALVQARATALWDTLQGRKHALCRLVQAVDWGKASGTPARLDVSLIIQALILWFDLLAHISAHQASQSLLLFFESFGHIWLITVHLVFLFTIGLSSFEHPSVSHHVAHHIWGQVQRSICVLNWLRLYRTAHSRVLCVESEFLFLRLLDIAWRLIFLGCIVSRRFLLLVLVPLRCTLLHSSLDFVAEVCHSICIGNLHLFHLDVA